MLKEAFKSSPAINLKALEYLQRQYLPGQLIPMPNHPFADFLLQISNLDLSWKMWGFLICVLIFHQIVLKVQIGLLELCFFCLVIFSATTNVSSLQMVMKDG